MAKNIVTARKKSGNKTKTDVTNDISNIKQTQRDLQKRMRTIATFSSSIGHELKNHLGTILVRAELSEKELVVIKKTVKDADYLIRNLQLQIQRVITGKSAKKEFKTCSISEDIKEVIKQYPFKTGECELIVVEAGKDFEYIGSSSLTMHIFYNLIRNSLRAINEADKGEITIKFRKSKKFNELIFRDTGSGIKKKFLPKIFTLFETRNIEQGAPRSA